MTNTSSASWTAGCALAVLALVGLGLTAAEVNRAPVSPQEVLESAAKGHVFFGRTVGPENQPLEGVVVEAVAAELGENPTIPDSWGPIRRTQKTLTALSDSEGRFRLNLPPGFQHLEINRVELEGHHWVTDRVWGHTEGRANSSIPGLYNTSFLLLGGPNVPGTYLAEQEYPAVFPLHPRDDPRPAAWPSRGGREKRGGNWIFHFPVPAMCPTAGGDADPNLTAQQIADVFTAWRKELREMTTRRDAGWSTRVEAEPYRDSLVAIAQRIIDRRKRGEIPSQLDKFHPPPK